MEFSGLRNKVLDEISFDIAPGSLTLICGQNGEGKSTLVNLIQRVIEPQSGSITIDGLLHEEYDINQLRASTVSLPQEQVVYPVSACKNIRLGIDSDLDISDLDIHEAAKNGGAYDFITNLRDGFDTNLGPAYGNPRKSYCNSGEHISNGALFMSEKFSKPYITLSGGQKQRLSAYVKEHLLITKTNLTYLSSRAFLRLQHSKSVKLILVDEPSSQMDARAEWDLFKRLLEQRNGKTMIVVTHNLANLAKLADQIMCVLPLLSYL